MSLDFSNGQEIPSKGAGRPVAVTAARLRNGLIDTSRYCNGEIALVPPATELTKRLGVTRNSIYAKGLDYVSLLECVTGLEVVRNSGLLLLGREVKIEPLDSHLEHEVALNPVEAQILGMAENLDQDARRRVGQALIQDIEQH